VHFWLMVDLLEQMGGLRFQRGQFGGAFGAGKGGGLW